jgi:uncharacterized protein YjbI with pentapeptide repeats
MNSRRMNVSQIWNRFNQRMNFWRSLRQQGLSFFFSLLFVWTAGSTLWVTGILPALAEDYNKEFLVGADFSGRVLTDSSFTKANLRNSNLSHTDLRGVSFFGANLEAANLEGANLSNATLDTARFSSANLTNAILEGAFAFNAKFEGATIEGADFTDVEFREDAQAMLCKVAKGTNPETGRNTRDTLDCP